MLGLEPLLDTILAALAYFGAHYSPAEYLLMTKVQCLLWTAADFVIVFYLLQIANLARDSMGVKKHRYPVFILFATLLFLPLLPIAQTGTAIFRLELLITVPHFLLILYILLANSRVFPDFLSKSMTDAEHQSL